MPQSHLTRRDFVSSISALTATAAALSAIRPARGQAGTNNQPAGVNRANKNSPIAISSANGLRSVARAVELIRAGSDPLDAAVDGVSIVENDPTDHSVGLGGLPNEEGIVELDASVMHGPTHRAGAVAALRNIKNPAAVAREVARRTDHALIVGEGALKFALRMGFKEENLLTEEARLEWLKWRSTLNRDDDWLEENEFDIPSLAPVPPAKPGEKRSDATLPTPSPSGRGRGEGFVPARSLASSSSAESSSSPQLSSRNPQASSHIFRDSLGVAHTWGTIHLSARTAAGDLAGCTTTSGLSWKLPGRVGDSPIIGAGLFTDNAVGSAGGTGRGEAAIHNCAAFHVVRRMEAGDDPTAACLFVLRAIAKKTLAKRLLDDKGRPNFGLTLYAVRKDGLYGSASYLRGAQFAIADDKPARLEACAYVFEKS
ncbi:MAG TPA: N(4)-(beta-N-acetylglucosaminyl)-L-asparaginase [Phycisphaerales bacterium]|nr:N(4)-(beta-N-acetylglucosaminyl)-L-asparaginase [Phycisphaerales bacterium]